MTKHAIFVAAGLMLATGCASGKGGLAAVSATQDAALVDSSAPPITQVDYKEPTTPEVIQPPSVVKTLDGTVESVSPQPVVFH